jgi:hypothetical protein
MLTVLVVAVSAVVAIRVALRDQYYNQLSKTASESGLAYAEACLAANAGVPLWTDVKPLMPNTDCSGNLIGGLDCTISANLTGQGLCSVTNIDAGVSSGRIISTFRVGRPTVNASNIAIRVFADGSTNLLRSSNSTIWRTYKQSSSLSSIPVISYTAPGVSSWTVPQGVSSAQIEACGGKGGNGGSIGSAGGTGGLGGCAKGTMTVSAGQVLTITVGQAGSNGGDGDVCASAGNGTPGAESSVKLGAVFEVRGYQGTFGTGAIVTGCEQDPEYGYWYNTGSSPGTNGTVGSGYVDPALTSTSINPGVQSGNGKVVISISGGYTKIYY